MTTQVQQIQEKFLQASKLLDRYIAENGASFDQAQNQMAIEAATILRRLRASSRDILMLNDVVVAASLSELDMDSEIRQVRASNPEFDRLMTRYSQVVQQTDLSAHDLGTLPHEGNEAIYELLERTTGYYYIAARLIRVLRELPGMSGLDSRPARDVRNKLLEHPEGGDSGVLTNSFGYGSMTGPVIKAMRRADQSDVFPDAGFILNTAALLDAVNGLLARILNEQNTK
jgi:hypothetical protein